MGVEEAVDIMTAEHSFSEFALNTSFPPSLLLRQRSLLYHLEQKGFASHCTVVTEPKDALKLVVVPHLEKSTGAKYNCNAAFVCCLSFTHPSSATETATLASQGAAKSSKRSWGQTQWSQQKARVCHAFQKGYCKFGASITNPSEKPDHNSNVLLGHPLYPAVKRVNDGLATLTIFGTCFESQEKYEEAYAANGGTPQVFQQLLKFNVGCYVHSTITHAVPHLEKYNSFVMYSSWVIEAMNKIWKSLLLQHSSNGGGHASEDIGLQTLRRVLRMSDPRIREFSKGVYEKELKRTYICGWCNGEKTDGHTKVCPKNPKRQVLTSAEALRILEENHV
eukprot:gene9375-11109_t